MGGAVAGLRAAQRFDLYRIGRQERSPAMQAVHPVALELGLDEAVMSTDHILQVADQRSHFRTGAKTEVEQVLVATQLTDAQRALAQRLAGNGSALHAGPAQVAVAFDQRHAPARLGGLDRRFLPRRSAADHQQIEIRGAHAAISLSMARTLSAFSSSIRASAR